MKISYNWLKELLPDLTQSPAEVAETLTLHSFETVVAGKLEIPKSVRVAKITKVEKHPNADRLQLATITDGEVESTVVCGAPNIAAGQVVPYSPPGAELKDEEGSTFTVREATIRGTKSPGMLNSLRELGLHPKAHEGIWILPQDLPLGGMLADHAPADTILDADITPNRAHDCMSHLGIARELAALLRLTVEEPAMAELPEAESAYAVTIEDDADTPRYLAAEVTGAVLAPSPIWMQVRLLAAGGKPKNNLVDITNYVLFEVGNPTHLFDATNLPGKAIGVRRARQGEKLVALDEVEYALTTEEIVVTSDNTPVAIAGVMGGQKSGVQEDTSNLLLEVANFRAYAIQETSRRLNLRSESSARFSKGIHPVQVETAAKRIVHLLQVEANASVTTMVDVYPKPRPLHVISFRPSAPASALGIEVAADETADILRRLRFEVAEEAGTWDAAYSSEPRLWRVTVPPDRLDIAGEHDVVEEVVRVIGLNSIAGRQLQKTDAVKLPGDIVLRERLRDNLVALGLTETYNRSFEPEDFAKHLDVATQPHLSLINPPAPELTHLRVSLLPGLLSNLATNRAAFGRNVGRRESALFEIGNVYSPGDNGRVPGVQEQQYVAGVMVGGAPAGEAVVQAIAEAYGVQSEIVVKTGSVSLLKRSIGQVLKYRLPIAVFEFNLSGLVLHAGEASARDITAPPTEGVQFIPYSKYPSTMRDISLLVDPAVTVEAIQGLIERTGGKLVADVDLFDELEWKDTGKKSLAFHIEYQAMDRTLTDREVGKIHDNILATLQQELSAEIR